MIAPAARLSARQIIAEVDADLADLQAAFYAAAAGADKSPALIRLCDYCGEAPATGYVRAYQAHVCEACYDDHHGGRSF